MEYADLKELTLKEIKVNGIILGKFGTFEIEQTYVNNTNKVLEVGYTFPIIETATITGFEIKVGDKCLKGKCKEKEKAKKEYVKNIVRGNSAYMMEQQRDNIFRISIGKIDKAEEVKIKILYIDKFDIVDNTINIIIPTLVTQKYKSGITSQLLYGKASYTIDFNLKIGEMLNIKEITSPSHEIKITSEDKCTRIEALNYDLRKDFKVNIQLKNEEQSKAIYSKTNEGVDIVYLSFMPEITENYEDSEKEYIFIIDVSGSMSGEKINKTKKAVIECLKQLDEGDKFNIIAFESEFEAMSMHPLDYNEENLKEAKKYIKKLEAMGGTEILAPVKFALYENKTDKTILLFTDGQVGNEEEIIRFVESNINRHRLFPFGIDDNVNSAFIRKLAQVGNGKAELIQPEEQIDDKIIRTFARIQTPLLENIKIDYGKNKIIDEIKEDGALFNYEPFNVWAKVEQLTDDIKLKGKIKENEYEWMIKKEKIQESIANLEVIFAKQEIDRLESYILNSDNDKRNDIYTNMIIEISEKYNINSKYTSFITVYERDNKLVEIPEYQEIVLNNNKKNFMSRIFNAEEYEECDEENDFDSSVPSDLDIPAFLRNTSRKKSKVKYDAKNSCPDVSNVLKNQEEDLDKMVEKEINEYYNEFMLKENKAILTYLLYAIFRIKYKKIDYSKFLEFLSERREEIMQNEQYQKLICVCYKELDSNRIKKELISYLDENYQKAIMTDMKINVGIKILTTEEVREIIETNTVIEHLNEMIWYIYANNLGCPSLAVSWMKKLR